VRISEKRAKRLIAQAIDAKHKLQLHKERANQVFKEGIATFFYYFGCLLGVLIVIGALLQTWSWSRLGIGQIQDCVKVDSIQWTEFQDTYSDPYVMFKTKTGKNEKLVLGDNFVSNATLKRLSEASFIEAGCIKVWYRSGEEEKVSRSHANFPFTELGGLGQWTLLVCLSSFLLSRLFNSDFLIISVGSETGAGLFFLALSSILAIGLALNGLNSRSEWLQRGVGQVRDCVKIEAVEWGDINKWKNRRSREAYAMFRTKTEKIIRLYIGNYSIPRSRDFPENDLLSTDCVTLWYQPGNEQEAGFSEIKPPFSDMSMWHWLVIWVCLFFAGLSWIFFSDKKNANSD
jgi:hypothetical protein